MSFVLTAALIFVSDRLQPLPTPIATTQIVGLKKPYTREPEPSPYRITASNFAAPREVPTDAFARADAEPKPAKLARKANAPNRQRLDDEKPSRPVSTRIADYPIDAMLAIH